MGKGYQNHKEWVRDITVRKDREKGEGKDVCVLAAGILGVKISRLFICLVCGLAAREV